MNTQQRIVTALAIVATIFVVVFEPSLSLRSAHSQPNKKKAKPAKKPDHALPLAQAKNRARLLHDVFSDTLDVMHRDYFGQGGGRKVVPSRAMESVFRRQKRRWRVKARWLAVNADAMHVDHKPKDKFERMAVRALSRGANEFEAVEKGTYRRAAAIHLFDSCLRCHLVLRSNKPRRRVAALVISLPLKR